LFNTSFFHRQEKPPAMLDVLRRNAGSWAIKIILGFIALTFVWWGVGTYSEQDRTVAASVGNEKITMAELAETVAGLEKTYREVYGAAFTPELERGLDLKKQAMESLIQRRILFAEAQKMGLSATDGEVQREIAATPAFQVNGQFREDRYRSVLTYNRITPAEFEASKRTEISLRKLEGLLSAGTLIPETEARDLFMVTMRRIRALVVTADPAKIGGVAAPTEAEIAARFEQSKESFRVPARVKVILAAFSPDIFLKDMHPTDAEVQAYYEGNPEKFRTEEQRLVSRIVLPYGRKDKEEVKKKALQILLETTKGKADFEAAARKYSRGNRGEAWLTRKEAGPELSTPLFSAPVDTVIGPVEMPGSYVLAYVSRIRFPETLPLSQVRERVAAQVSREKAKDLAVIKVYEAQPKAVSTKDVKGTAAAYGVPAAETGWIGGDGGPGFPPAVAQEALLLSSGEVGPVKTVGDTHYLFQIAAKQDSRIPPLQDVRSQVAAVVSREKRVAAARSALLQALSDSKTAAALEAAAKKAGLETGVTGWFAPLSDPVPGALATSEEIRRDLSALSQRNPVSPKIFPGPDGRSFTIAFLGEQLPDNAEWDRKKTDFLRGMIEQRKSAMLEAFLSDRRKTIKVEVNPAALK
jgi:peptidyl-prolyl cis-trans isomerase D